MRVLVTGGAGFIGSHFAKRLAAAGDEVIVLDKLTYSGNPANLEGAELEFVEGDICNPEAVAAAGDGCDAVVNFAAETHVDRSIHGASEFIETDVLGTYVLLDWVRERGARLVQVSTDEVYGDVEPGVYAAITRGSNTYGPNQYPEKIIPLFVTNALDGERLPLYGDGRQTRDWLHVEDHSAAVELVLREGVGGEAYNVGAGEELENRELTRMILELTGAGESLVRHVEDRLGHDRRYSLDSSKLRALGWEPRRKLADGLPETVAWYRENRQWWEPIKSGEYRSYYERQYAQRLR